MAKTLNHVHKYRKRVYKKTGYALFFCALPGCYHKIEAELAIGKETLCNICGDEFIMNEYAFKLLKPHCNSCGKVKVKDAEGNGRFVRKVANKKLVGIATETSQDLRSRLDNLDRIDVEDDI